MRVKLSVLFSSWGRLFCLLGFLAHTVAMAQSWQEASGYRFKPLAVSADGTAGFSLLTPVQTGISFTNSLPESRYLTNQILPNGSGVAAGDIDGDGWCDLFFSGLGGGSRLYRNLRNWHFEDITERAGMACSNLDATGAVFADIDGDGDLDLIVNSIGGGTHVFINNGKGHFTASSQTLNPGRGGTSLALGDSTGKGMLDLYVSNYRVSTIMDAPGTRFSVKMIDNQPVVTTINGQPLTDPEWTNRFRFKIEMSAGRNRLGREELGEADVFYRNDGKGHFEAVPWTSGVFLDEDGQPLASPPFDWGLSVLFRDFNRDGKPDLYICNDFATPDRLWINDGKGHFRAVPQAALRETCFSSMGIDAADLNRDGLDDFIVVDMRSRDHRRLLTQRQSMRAEMTQAALASERPQYPRNMLYLNRGDGTWAEIAQYAGLEASEWSWAPIFLDVDLDGYEDFLAPNGFERDNMNVDVQNRINQAKAAKKILSTEDLLLRKQFPRLATENLAFRNRGDLRFEEIGREWGFNTPVISQGACLADLDNDGDLDVVLNNMNDAAGLYKNNSPAPRIAIRLKGKSPNTCGIGARIVVTGGPVAQSQEMQCGGRYLSSDDPMRVFAAGGLTNRLRIEVSWRNGQHSTIANAQPNCLYEIDEAQASSSDSRITTPGSRIPSPIFEDASVLLSHTHHEEPFDDFARQPLLPKRLSQLGPGVCWWDMNGDGWEDLIVGSGKGGQTACFLNDGKGGFKRSSQAPWNMIAMRDQTTILGWAPGAVLTGGANYEDSDAYGAAVSICRMGQSQPEEFVPGWESSVGPMALVDYNGDGSLDLFIGGRVVPGRYPMAANSRLYRQKDGKLLLDEANSALLREAGLIGGAVWSDLDGDGWPDLILACEWGPIRIFHNDKGTLKETTKELGLDKFTGWWNGVTTGDFDGDGRLDIIASNWGRNTKYECLRKKPLRLYYGNLSDTDSMDMIESAFDPGLKNYAPIKMLDSISKAMPFLAGRYATFQAWAETGVEEALEDCKDRLHHYDANWLESTLFLNRGDRFESIILPMEAQLAPAFAVCVADFDGDGNEDVFLSQNFFAVDNETSRYDAGRGLWLRGDGHGAFNAVPGQESGVRVYGEQRGAAICDYDGDGRVDLALTQNSSETKLFHNVAGKPGLRVRLHGPSGNPMGFNSVLRLKFGDRLGPAREIHAGSGYWSQDAGVAVFGLPAQPTQLWVRWLGGQSTIVDLPPAALEVILSSDGKIEKIR